MNELDNIRREGVRKIFSLICDSGKQSRAELSRRSGISLMTVGKIVDSLEARGLVSQVKESSNRAGRRASYVHVSTDICFIILDVMQKECRAYISGLDLAYREIEECHTLRRDGEIPIEFFRRVSSRIALLPGEKFCAGIGVILPHLPSNALEYISSDELLASAKEILGDSLYASERLRVSALAELDSKEGEDDSRLLYLWLGDSAGAVYSKNRKIVFTSDMLGCMLKDGEPLYEGLRCIDRKIRLSSAMQIIHSSLMCCPCDTLILDGPVLKEREITPAKVESEFAKLPIPPGYKLPHMTVASHSAHDGMGIVLRERLLKRMKL